MGDRRFRFRDRSIDVHVVDIVVRISLLQQYPESRFARIDSDSLVNISEVHKIPYDRQGPRYEARWRARKYIQITERDSSGPITICLRHRWGRFICSATRALSRRDLREYYKRLREYLRLEKNNVFTFHFNI